MNRKDETRYKKLCSDEGLKLRASNGEPISVRINESGTVSLATRLKPDNGGIGSFDITGLEPQKAASKKKSFWRKLWNTIKGAAAAIVDAVTVPIFGYRCRPDCQIDLSNGGFSFGIKCSEA